MRARVDGVLRSLDEEIPLDKRKNHTIEIVVDRLPLKPGSEKRLEASIETAAKLANGLVTVVGRQWRREALFAKAGLPRIAAPASRSSSRARSPSTARSARAKRATAWAAPGASIPPKSSSILPSRCSMADSAPAPVPPTCSSSSAMPPQRCASKSTSRSKSCPRSSQALLLEGGNGFRRHHQDPRPIRTKKPAPVIASG